MPHKGLSPWLQRKVWRSRRWRSAKRGMDRRIAMRSGGWTSNWTQLKPTTSYFSCRFVAWNCLKAWELAGYFPAEKLQKHDTIASYCSSYLSIFSGFKLGAPKLPSNFWTRAGFRPRQLSLQRRIRRIRRRGCVSLGLAPRSPTLGKTHCDFVAAEAFWIPVFECIRAINHECRKSSGRCLMNIDKHHHESHHLQSCWLGCDRTALQPPWPN